MHLVCSTELLLRAIRSVAHLQQGKKNPGLEQVRLLASASPDGGQATLTVLGWKSQRRVGLFATLPAQVERPGQVSVNASHFAEYLATLHAATVQLTQNLSPDQGAASMGKTPEGKVLPPLQIVCRWTSAGGHEAKRSARFLVHATAGSGDFPLEQWRRNGLSVATLSARMLRAALAICAPLAQSREGKADLSDMFGVLVRFDAEGLLLTATTRWDLASQRVALSGTAAFAEPCHVLFTGSDLVWLSKVLRDEEQIHLRLFREGEQAILLVDTADLALFCTGRTTHLPTYWEQAPCYPALGRLVIEREVFVQAVARLARGAREDEIESIQFQSTGDQLLLRLAREQDDPEQMQVNLTLVSITAPLPPMLLDAKRACQLARKLQGATVALEWGSFLQQLKEKQQMVGFLRLVSEAVGAMLVMARSDIPGEEPAETQEDVAASSSPLPTNPSSQDASAVAQDPASVPVARKEPISMPSTLPSFLTGISADEALPQLAMYYHRQLLQDSQSAAFREACAWLRDQCFSAQNQQEAWEMVQAQARGIWSEREVQCLYQQAAGLLQQVLDAGGSLQPLIVGITDGFRHFCLHCGQDAEKRDAIRFFRERDRRWLLIPEISHAPRSVYDRCQFCLQPLFPTEVVIFVPAGTVKHVPGCTCQQCNQRALAFVLDVYACDRQTQQIVLPRLSQVIAPSRQQCVERAVALCWREGWYMRSEDPRTHALSALALAPLPEKNDASVHETIA